MILFMEVDLLETESSARLIKDGAKEKKDSSLLKKLSQAKS
jgi:hypothetical protein